MAHKGYTGFDFFSASDAPLCGFTQPFTQAVGPGRYSPGAGNWNPFAQSIDNRWALTSATNATPFIGFAWMYSVAVAEQCVITGADGATGQFTLTWDGLAQTFKVRAGQGLSGSVLATSSAVTSLSPGSWNHLELVCSIADSGSVQVKLNGVSLFTASGDTKVSSTAQLTHLVLPATSSAGGNVLMSYDDLYCIDTSTGDGPSASIGDCRVRPLKPTSDGTHHDFTTTSGTTHSDKVQSLTGTGAVASATVGAKDSYHFPTVPSSSVILGVKINVEMAKTDAGSRSVAPLVRVGTTDYDGTPIALAASQKVYSQIFGKNPATGSQWLVAEVNAAEFGVDVTA